MNFLEPPDAHNGLFLMTEKMEEKVFESEIKLL